MPPGCSQYTMKVHLNSRDRSTYCPEFRKNRNIRPNTKHPTPNTSITSISHQPSHIRAQPYTVTGSIVWFENSPPVSSCYSSHSDWHPPKSRRIEPTCPRPTWSTT